MQCLQSDSRLEFESELKVEPAERQTFYGEDEKSKSATTRLSNDI